MNSMVSFNTPVFFYYENVFLFKICKILLPTERMMPVFVLLLGIFWGRNRQRAFLECLTLLHAPILITIAKVLSGS